MHGIAKAFLSACLSVRLSTVCIATKEKITCARILIPYERSFILAFRHEDWLVRDDTIVLDILDQTDPVRAKTPIVQSIFARSASAVTRREKVKFTLIGSPLRAFQ